MHDAARDASWDAVVLSGSSIHLSEPIRVGSVAKDLLVLTQQLPDVPIVGICFGMRRSGVLIDVDVADACFSHGDTVTAAPPHFDVLAS